MKGFSECSCGNSNLSNIVESCEQRDHIDQLPEVRGTSKFQDPSSTEWWTPTYLIAALAATKEGL